MLFLWVGCGSLLPSAPHVPAAACVDVQGLVDPATGELYYMSHITSASLWEKRNETLRSEAELRRLVVPRLDNEYRGEVSACYSSSRDRVRDPACSPFLCTYT